MSTETGKSPDGQESGDRPRRRDHHHIHKQGPYFGLEGDLDVIYGDGTWESLADVLREPEEDRWQSRRNLWEIAESAWERQSYLRAAAADERADAAREPEESAGEER